MWNKEFWKDTAERALKTFAQTLAATFVVGIPLWEQDAVTVAGVAVTATVLSVLTSIGSSGVGDKDTASVLSSHHVKY